MNNRVVITPDNLSLCRIEERCLNCGMCKKICKSKNNLVDEDCIRCGQCILNCPSGALIPVYNYKKVLNYIKDTTKTVIVSVAPAVRVTIGDEFNFAPGEFLEGKLVSALKEIGFDYVFDIAFGADITVFEEAQEFIKRLNTKKNLPQFSSCCPSWVMYINKYFKEYKNNLSTCKSPIGMQGTVINNYFLPLNNISRSDVINVVIAPCVSKKSEIKLYENDDVDFVLTTTELAMMLRELNIDLKDIKEKEFDKLLGTSSKNSLSFGTSGGVLTAVIRTVYFMLNNKVANENLISFEDLENYSEATVNLEKTTIKVAKVYGIKNFLKIKDKLNEFDFIEFMACDNGCVGGGGQTLLAANKVLEYNSKRYENLKNNNHKIIDSFENPELQEFYNSNLIENNRNELLHNK
jgi:ferredoxin hydrogenase